MITTTCIKSEVQAVIDEMLKTHRHGVSSLEENNDCGIHCSGTGKIPIWWVFADDHSVYGKLKRSRIQIIHTVGRPLYVRVSGTGGFYDYQLFAIRRRNLTQVVGLIYEYLYLKTLSREDLLSALMNMEHTSFGYKQTILTL